MGAWDDGLYDNDSALDNLSELVLDDDLDRLPAAELAAAIGLRLWMQPVDLDIKADDYKLLLHDRRAEFDSLTDAARLALERVAADPAAAVTGRSRTPEVRAAIGGYCDGPRVDELLRVPGGEPVLRRLRDRCASLLDGCLRGEGWDLYEASGELGALGVLLELSQVGVTATPEQLAAWRAGFDRVDAATSDEEREFWDGYAARARKAFDLLQ